MNKNIVENFKKNKRLWFAVVVVLAAGIFFRTYNFHDWLRFNADQGRDAAIVSAVLDGKENLPLLGPKAGGTAFLLGPAFYYMQIVAAKIFGNAPDKMAYPDLLTGILCIPLLFFFLRKYFDAKISLALTFVFSLSAFAIRWARFAWNPNSTPFWTLLALYALHEIMIKKDNRKFLWSIIAGVSIGIGIQLHTLLLLSLPITLTILFVWMLFKKNKAWKYFFVVFVMALFLNIPQVMSEYSSNGANVRAFFDGIQTKQENQHSIVENFVHGNSSVAQIVPDILTGYEIADDFKITFDGNHAGDVVVSILGALFTLSGVILAIRYYKREKDVDKKVFLTIIATYSIILYVILLKLSFTISVRMYLVLFFMPFFLLGFWLKFCQEKVVQHRNEILILACALLIIANLFFIRRYFEDFASYAAGKGTVNIATLGGVERFADFIRDSSRGESTAYVTGDKKFLFITFRPIAYLVERSGEKMDMIGSNELAKLKIAKFYYIVRENKLDNFKDDPYYKVTKQATYGKFSILLVEKK